MGTLPIPINAAEAIIERFWDPTHTPMNAWRCDTDTGTGGQCVPFWFGAMVKWADGSGRTVARLSRDADWCIDGYDGLTLCITSASTVRHTITAVIDDSESTLVADVPGCDNFMEIDAPLSGRRIERIEIRLTDAAPGPGQCRLMWLGVFNHAARDKMRAAPCVFEHRLDAFMLPPEQAVSVAPTLGLFFGAGDVEALRAKCASPPYSLLVDQLRQRAKAALKLEPWRGIGRFPNEAPPRGARGYVTHIDPLAMRLGAFVGLIDNDPQLLRMALRHALAMAHCEYWFPDFIEQFPGSTFEQRAFFDYRYGTNVVFAWDWAGALLTKAGRELLAYTIATKALPRIHMTLMRHRYIRECNQGAYMAYGAIVCQAALSKVWPYAKDYIDIGKAALDETMNTYLAPDGGAFEGVGYVSATIGHALTAYQAIARLRGVPLRDVVPARVIQSANYLAAMLSTAPPIGSSINVADGGRPGSTLYPECLPLLAQLAAKEEGVSLNALLAGIARQPLKVEGFGTPGSVFVAMFGKPTESLPSETPRPPVFRVLEHTGQLCSCRSTPHGLVRLQVIGAPARAGHSHEDKGSFVIEAFGEEIAIDRGQMEYSDPRCGVLKAARYHNVLTPLDASDEPIAQVNPCPSAVLPAGEGDATRLRAWVDASGTWGPRVRRWVRRFESDEPCVIDVIDEMEFASDASAGGASATAVAFLVHSRYPWTRDDARGGWVARGERAEMLVSPKWEPSRVFAGEDFVDGRKLPAYTLSLHTPAASSHHLRTRLVVSPVTA